MLQSCNESLDSLQQTANPVVRTFAIQVFQLVSQVAQCIDNITDDVAENYPPSLKTEWNEFFSQGSFTVLLPVFVSISGELVFCKVADEIDHRKNESRLVDGLIIDQFERLYKYDND